MKKQARTDTVSDLEIRASFEFRVSDFPSEFVMRTRRSLSISRRRHPVPLPLPGETPTFAGNADFGLRVPCARDQLGSAKESM